MHYIKLTIVSIFICSCTINKKSDINLNEPNEDVVTESKRVPAKQIDPVIINNIQYGKHLNEIIATNITTNEMIWRKEIYANDFDSQLEKGVQEIHIDSILKISNNVLMIRNETKDYYLLNLISRDIDILEGLPSVESQKDYSIIITRSSQSEFEKFNNNKQYTLLDDIKCFQSKKIKNVTENEVDLKLTNGSYFNLKKEKVDEQFYGYTFFQFNKELNVYILWENWLEAGHPIMINGANGKESIIFGKSFRANENGALTANFGQDIGAGWTPNGIQVYQVEKNDLKHLFSFEPRNALNVIWGPNEIHWQNDSTLLIECIEDNPKGGTLTKYRKLKFFKL